MLVRSRVIGALEAKRDRFARYQIDIKERSNRFHEALEQLPSLSREEIETRLAASGVDWPGAYPTAEHDRLRDIVLSFGAQWNSHEEARAWAMQVLLDQTTFAVDGSQIPPSRDFSVPVAAIQVGWFENPHTPKRPYVKDLHFDVLAPDELAAQADDPSPSEGQPGAGPFPDTLVNLRRFEAECRAVCDYARSQAGLIPAPLCFVDGSLIVSFARHMSPALRQSYLDAVAAVLHASQTARVPVVGYVDTSFARDLTEMLSHTFDLPRPAHLSDGGLLRPRMQWGDRSQAYWCARDDGVLPLYDERAGRIAFVYLKTTGDGHPARVELPGWLLEDGAELERVLNLIRAECVVGNGYPYALETADVVAVISVEDRNRFYAAFQQFAEKEGLTVRYSRKALSKATRR
jgi:hypothetical protein